VVRSTRIVVISTIALAAACSGVGPSGAPTAASPTTAAPATTVAPAGSPAPTTTADVLERAASVVTAFFRARGRYDWDAAAEVTTGAAASFVTHLSVAHLLTERTAPLPEVPTVEADLTGVRRSGTEVGVDGEVTLRWSDGATDTFGDLRFADVGGDLLLADYSNGAGPLSGHLVDGSGVDHGTAGEVDVALVAAVWLAPDPVVAVTLRIENGGDDAVGLDEDGVAVVPDGGAPVGAAYRKQIEAEPGATGWVLAELRGDPLPVDGGELRVAVADGAGRPVGTATLDLPAFGDA
jgi:hypothetical protein